MRRPRTAVRFLGSRATGRATRSSWQRASGITRICEVLGYEAIPEHYETRADVWVPEARLAIEVQRWATDYRKRTQNLAGKGADVLWLMPEEGEQPYAPPTIDAVYNLPSARLKVHARGDRDTLLAPWINDADQAKAVLSVFGTSARLARERDRLHTGYTDFKRFLHEILTDRRHWYPPRTPNLPYAWKGAWILDDDLEHLRQQQQQRRPAPTPPIETPPEPERLEVAATATTEPSTPEAGGPAEAPPIKESAEPAPDRELKVDQVKAQPPAAYFTPERPSRTYTPPSGSGRPAVPEPTLRWWRRLTRWLRS